MITGEKTTDKTDSGNNEKSGSDDDTDSQKGNSDHENDDFNDNDYAPQ